MFRKFLSLSIIVSFFLTSLGPLPQAHADTVPGLPVPGTMINLSPAYEPVIIKGLTVHKDNPFLFDFIVDIGQDRMSGEPLKKEGEKLIKYFLAGLAIPDKDLWVNLSPYEKNRMVPEVLGQTDMGRDLLEQDYILKQITASLIYPEKQLGRNFWDKVYAKAQQMYGTTEVPVNTFNKVWIMADKAEVFEHNQTAFVVGCHLKVMLEEDYLAFSKHQGQPGDMALAVSPSTLPSDSGLNAKAPQGNHRPTSTLASNIVRAIILPELEKEVNTGKNFANLRQIFNSVILSSWYKKNLKEALLNQMYADRAKIKGIERPGAIGVIARSEATKQSLQDISPEQIYQQYLKAYKKGVFNYIKEDVNAAGATVPRKYFSGGTVVGVTPMVIKDIAMGTKELAGTMPTGPKGEGRLEYFHTGFNARGALPPVRFDAAMTAVSVKYEDGMWEIAIGEGENKIVIQSLDISDLAKKLEEALGEGVNIQASLGILDIHIPSREQLYTVDAIDAFKLKETIEKIIASKAPAAREHIMITEANFPILAPEIDAKGSPAESSLIGRLKLTYGLTKTADSFKAIVMGPSEGKTDFELAQQIIKSGQIDPERTWAKDQWYALKLFVAMRFILYYEFNHPSGKQQIPNRPVELIIINYLGQDAEHKDIAKSAQEIAEAYQKDPTFGQQKIVWSEYRQAFEQILETAELLYNGLKDAYAEALAEYAKQVTLIHNTSKITNGGATSKTVAAVGTKYGNLTISKAPPTESTETHLTAPPVSTISKAPLTEANETHPTNVNAGEIDRLIEAGNGVIRAGNKYYQNTVHKQLQRLFGFGVGVPQEKLDHIWDALTGKLPMSQWLDLEKDILPHPANSAAPDHDRHDRILKFMVIYTLLRQPLDSEGQQEPVLALDEIFLSRVKGLFDPESHMTEKKFRDTNSYLQLGGFFTKVPLGPNNEEDYWWKQYNSDVVKAFGDKSKESPHNAASVVDFKASSAELKASPAVGLKAAVPAPSVAVAQNTFKTVHIDHFRAHLEKVSNDANGPFFPLSPGRIKLIWRKVVEPEGAKAIQEWIYEIESQLSAELPAGQVMDRVPYYRAAFAVFRALYQQREEELTPLEVDGTRGGQVIRFINILARRTAGTENRLDESIPGLRVPAQNILTQLDAAMTTKAPIVDHAALALSSGPGGIDLNTTNGMQWKVSKDGSGVEMNVDPAMIERVRREGINSLSPVIFKITPITSIWPLAGLQAPVNG